MGWTRWWDGDDGGGQKKGFECDQRDLERQDKKDDGDKERPPSEEPPAWLREPLRSILTSEASQEGDRLAWLQSWSASSSNHTNGRPDFAQMGFWQSGSSNLISRLRVRPASISPTIPPSCSAISAKCFGFTFKNVFIIVQNVVDVSSYKICAQISNWHSK